MLTVTTIVLHIKPPFCSLSMENSHQVKTFLCKYLHICMQYLHAIILRHQVDLKGHNTFWDHLCGYGLSFFKRWWKAIFFTEGNSNRTHFSSCNTSQVLCLAFCNARAQTEIYFYVFSRSLREIILKANRLEIFWASPPYYLKCNMAPFK